MLFLQEMDEAGTEAVADALNLYYVYASASTHPKSGRDFGNAVLSPAPLEARAVIELPHKARVGGQPRIAISAVAHLNGSDDVTLCCSQTEIPALSSTRHQEQFAALASTAADWQTDHVAVGGDFNTVTRKGVRALIAILRIQTSPTCPSTPSLHCVGAVRISRWTTSSPGGCGRSSPGWFAIWTSAITRQSG